MPDERYNAIHNAREFLRSLLDPKKTPRVPKKIRKEAYWCLKHFPTSLDMEHIALKASDIISSERKK